MTMLSAMLLLAWFAVTGWAAWLLYHAHHPVWAVVVPILMLTMVRVKDGGEVGE